MIKQTTIHKENIRELETMLRKENNIHIIKDAFKTNIILSDYKKNICICQYTRKNINYYNVYIFDNVIISYLFKIENNKYSFKKEVKNG